MPDDDQEGRRKRLAKEEADRAKGAAGEAPAPPEKKGGKPRSALDDLDAFLAKLKVGADGAGANRPVDMDRLLDELEDEARPELPKRPPEEEKPPAQEERRAAEEALKPARKSEEEEVAEEELDLGEELEMEIAPPAREEEPQKEEMRPASILPPLEASAAPLAERVDGVRANVGRVNGGRVNGGRVNGGRVNGGRVNGGRVNGGRVNGGRVNGGRVNGGRVNGGRVNGGRVNGGRVNGGFTNGSRAAARRTQARSRLVATVSTAALFGSILVPLLLLYPASPAYTIDGSFADWAGDPAVTDAVSDQTANPNVDLVGFAARSDARTLYFYFQVTQGGAVFGAPGDQGPVTGYSLLIDADRDAATGYLAFGLGADFMVTISGAGGQAFANEVRAFRSGAFDPTDARGFMPAGASRSASRGNQLEAAVGLALLGLSAADRPNLLFIAQDSAGNVDVGDAVFTTAPGILKLYQDGTLPPVIPVQGETRLLTVQGQAEGADIRLLSLDLFVEGQGGAGIQLTRVVAGGQSQSTAATGFAGSVMRVTLTLDSLRDFADGAAARSLEFYGRALGPNGSVVRAYLRGPGDVQTSTATPGAAGLGSVLAPVRFSSAYVGQAPAVVRIDGAFADWNQAVPPDNDPRNDVAMGSSGRGASSPNETPYDAGLDIVASRAEISGASREVNFFLEVAGSIMAPNMLPPLVRPAPSVPSTGSGGGGPLPDEGRAVEVATVYMDADANASTGWARFAGLGVDSILTISAAGGGYGRAPRQTDTSLTRWNQTRQAFAPSNASASVAFNSSAMEAQLPGDALCSTGCSSVRYVFHLEGKGLGYDETGVHAATSRALGDAIFLDEARTRVQNIYQGDARQQVLAVSVTVPSTRTEPVSVTGFEAVVEGAAPGAVLALSAFADAGQDGTLDAQELGEPALGEAAMTANGHVSLRFSPAVELIPGARLALVVTVDIAPDAAAPSWFNLSLAPLDGVRTWPVTEVRQTWPDIPVPIRILPYVSPGYRGQANLKLNEFSLTGDWVEIYDTTAAATSLTSPLQIGITITLTDNKAVLISNLTMVDGTGSTNSNGFAVFTATINNSAGNTYYHIRLWSYSAGTGNVTLDDIEIPKGTTTSNMYGRYPDGSSNWTVTTSTTQNSANAIPEFSDFGVPLMGALAVFAVTRRGSRGRSAAGAPGLGAGL